MIPDLEEAQVVQQVEHIEKFITDAKGVITFKREPERIHLSYPIKASNYAYFGYIHFKLEEPEEMSKLDEHMRLDNNVLRYLIVKTDPDSKKNAPSLRTYRAKPKAEAPVEEAKPKTDTKEIEQQLEGVLENL